ncbi:MAG: damage-inducible protein J [Lactobacillus sp.]|nr:damage-inducible protein J [Lactobacillus sp.]
MRKVSKTINLDENLQRELTEKLSQIGLTLDEYFLLAAKQFLIQGRVPFEITEKVKFNDETRKALIRSLAEEEGLLPNTSTELNLKSIDNLF